MLESKSSILSSWLNARKTEYKIVCICNKYQYYNKYCDNYSSVSIEIICYFFQ